MPNSINNSKDSNFIYNEQDKALLLNKKSSTVIPGMKSFLELFFFLIIKR
jgi:hypothetical protein